MTATNHALTGATIGLLVGNPLIALPAAFLSHFICDSIPHLDTHDPPMYKRTWFTRMLLVDALVCVGIVGSLALNHPLHWQLAAICAFLATSPDLMWINEYLRVRRKQADQPMRLSIMRFHYFIQWFARPIGGLVEVAWFIGLGTIFITLLKG
jgi:hypothetical protein